MRAFGFTHHKQTSVKSHIQAAEVPVRSSGVCSRPGTMRRNYKDTLAEQQGGADSCEAPGRRTAANAIIVDTSSWF